MVELYATSTHAGKQRFRTCDFREQVDLLEWWG